MRGGQINIDSLNLAESQLDCEERNRKGLRAVLTGPELSAVGFNLAWLDLFWIGLVFMYWFGLVFIPSPW